MLGPHIILDKSTWQALSANECLSLGRYYTPIIPPILTREMLTNITTDKGLQAFSLLAYKVTRTSFNVLPHFTRLAKINLLGASVPMNGQQIPTFEMKTVRMPDGTTSGFLDDTKKSFLFHRWSEAVVTDEERAKANELFQLREHIDLNATKQFLEQHKKVRGFKSLADAWDAISKATQEAWDQWAQITLFCRGLGISRFTREKIEKRWTAVGFPSFETFAPYAFFVHKLNVLFATAIHEGLVLTSKKAKTNLDLEYLYYLPFAMVFASHDKFFNDFAPLVTRASQDFVTGGELKKDLSSISAAYLAGKVDGVECPPWPELIEGSLTVQLWKRHFKKAPR